MPGHMFLESFHMGHFLSPMNPKFLYFCCTISRGARVLNENLEKLAYCCRFLYLLAQRLSVCFYLGFFLLTLSNRYSVSDTSAKKAVHGLLLSAYRSNARWRF